jgi:hypothetical protein
MAALPWAAEPARDPMRDVAANIAMLSAARGLTRHQPDCPLEAADVVAQALRDMSAEERQEAARMLQATQERVYATIMALRAREGPISGDDVRAAFRETAT